MRKPIPYSCPICASRLPRAASRCFFCESPLPFHKGKATAVARPRLPRANPEALRKQELPRLYIAAQDFGKLENLAHIALSERTGGDLLRSELDRAIVCDGQAVPHGVVRMGSIIVLRDRGEDGSAQKIRGMLVYPGEFHPHLPSIAVSSPLGSAILGLSVGDVMPYEAVDGIRHVATVLSVVRPELRHDSRTGDLPSHEGVAP